MSPRKPVIALQMFSMRSLGPLENQLTAVAEAGFRSLEALEEHLEQPVHLKRLLVANGLNAASAHVRLQTLRHARSRIIDACKVCEISQVFLPTIDDIIQVDSTDAWQRLGEELGELAGHFRREGMVLGYHNKSRGFSSLRGGRYGFEILFSAAEGSTLKWQADIAWLKRAGLDPIEWLKRYRKVLLSAHVKDEAPIGSNLDEEGWTDIGAGVMAWPLLWKTALGCGAETLIIEHDNPNEPFEFANRSFAYVSRFNRR